MKKAAYIFLLLFPLFSFSQLKEKHNPLFTIRGDVGIPRTISSQMFRTAFNGVVESNISFNVKVFGNLFFGAGYQYNNFALRKIPELASSDPKFGNTYYDTKVIGHSGFIKIGFDKFFSDIGYVSYSFNTGIMNAGYADRIKQADTFAENLPITTTKFSAPYLQPELGFNFLAEKRVSFSLLLSYTTLLYKFNPKAAGLNQIEVVSKQRNGNYMSWINIGFGFNILLGK